MDSDDRRHGECAALFQGFRGRLVIPQLVVTEVAYFVEEKLGLAVQSRFLADLLKGNFITEPVAAVDWIRILRLLTQYADLRLGTVEASVVAAAERLRIPTMITLDRGHFSVVRPSHVSRFEILP